MSFTFVLKDKGTTNQGWWLKVSNTEELKEYNENAKSPIIKAFKSATNCREFESAETWEMLHKLGIKSVPLKPHVTYEGFALGTYAQNNGISLMEAAVKLDIEKITQQVEALEQGFNVYINKNGGWHSGKNDYDDWYRSETLAFPNFKKNQIKVEKFPMGEHYYAYIDKMQVRDGDTLKWNTYEEAYAHALAIVGDKNNPNRRRKTEQKVR